MKELAIYVLITSAVWTYNIAQYRWSNTNIYIGKERGRGKKTSNLFGHSLFECDYQINDFYVTNTETPHIRFNLLYYYYSR